MEVDIKLDLENGETVVIKEDVMEFDECYKTFDITDKELDEKGSFTINHYFSYDERLYAIELEYIDGSILPLMKCRPREVQYAN